MAQLPIPIRLPRANVRQIGSDSLNSEHHWIITEIILCDRKPHSPPALDVRPKASVADLLAMAFDATLCPINFSALLGQTGSRHGIQFSGFHDIRGGLLGGLRLWDKDQPPRSEE